MGRKGWFKHSREHAMAARGKKVYNQNKLNARRVSMPRMPVVYNRPMVSEDGNIYNTFHDLVNKKVVVIETLLGDDKATAYKVVPLSELRQKGEKTLVDPNQGEWIVVKEHKTNEAAKAFQNELIRQGTNVGQKDKPSSPAQHRLGKKLNIENPEKYKYNALKEVIHESFPENRVPDEGETEAQFKERMAMWDMNLKDLGAKVTPEHLKGKGFNTADKKSGFSTKSKSPERVIPRFTESAMEPPKRTTSPTKKTTPPGTYSIKDLARKKGNIIVKEEKKHISIEEAKKISEKTAELQAMERDREMRRKGWKR